MPGCALLELSACFSQEAPGGGVKTGMWKQMTFALVSGLVLNVASASAQSFDSLDAIIGIDKRIRDRKHDKRMKEKAEERRRDRRDSHRNDKCNDHRKCRDYSRDHHNRHR